MFPRVVVGIFTSLGVYENTEDFTGSGAWTIGTAFSVKRAPDASIIIPAGGGINVLSPLTFEPGAAFVAPAGATYFLFTVS